MKDYAYVEMTDVCDSGRNLAMKARQGFQKIKIMSDVYINSRWLHILRVVRKPEGSTFNVH